MLAATALASGLPPFSDYEVILNRKPFGDPKIVAQSAGVDKATEAAIAEENKAKQTLAKQLHLVAVNIMPSGAIVVGLVDKTTNPSRSMLLAPGESEAGYKVLEANVNEETAKIEKDGTIITLKLGKGLVEEQATAEEGAEGQLGTPVETPPLEQPPVNPPPRADGAQPQMPHRSLVRPGLRNFRGGVGFRQKKMEQNRLEEQQREATEQKLAQAATVAAEKKMNEKLNAREREMNLRLIRQGQQPLSEIELTPEEERTLIDEGVIPEQSQQ